MNDQQAESINNAALLREAVYCRKRVETLEEQLAWMTASRDRWHSSALTKHMAEDAEGGVISYDGEWCVKNIKFDGVTITVYRNGLVARAHKGE